MIQRYTDGSHFTATDRSQIRLTRLRSPARYNSAVYGMVIENPLQIS